MVDDSSTWSDAQALTFLLMHAAFADGEFSNSEQKWLKINLGTAAFDVIYPYYLALSVDGREKQVQALFQARFANAQALKVLGDSLRELFLTDGQYSELEEGILSTWKQKYLNHPQ